MLGTKRSAISAELTRFLSDNWLAALAIDLGVVQRLRKVDIVCFVFTLILGVPVGQRRSIAGLRRAFELASGVTIAPSSFFDRFNKPLVDLLKTTANHLIDEVAKDKGAALQCAIEGVGDVLAADATVFGSDKLHAMVNVTGTTANRLKLTDSTTHDSQVWKRIGKWVRGHLLIVDLGYYDFHLFWRVDKQGGFFLSRAKTNFNPLIVGINKRHRGRAMDVVGHKLQEVLPRFKRQVFDFQVRVEVKKRVYKGVRRKTHFVIRLVGIWNSERGRYHLYLTNLSPDDLGAEAVGEWYRLRWQAELLWTSLKTEGRLAQLPSHKTEVKHALIWASIAYVLCGKVLLRWLRARLSGGQWLNTRHFERVFESIRNVLLLDLLAQRRDDTQIEDPLLELLMHELSTSSGRPSTPFSTAFVC